MIYFVLRCTEDGVSIVDYTKTELEKYLKSELEQELEPTFLSGIPEQDKGFWQDVPEDSMLIIKGEIIVPKKKNVVTKYEVD